MFSLIFNRKKRRVAKGDSVMLKREYQSNYPHVPTNIILKISAVANKIVTVVFISNNGQDICTEQLSASALNKVY